MKIKYNKITKFNAAFNLKKKETKMEKLVRWEERKKI